MDDNKIDITRTIEDAFKGLKKLWWIFILLISLFSGLFYLRARQSYVPMYCAEATFTININSGYSNGAYYNSAAASQLSKTFPYILTSGVLSDLVAEDLGLSYVPASISAYAEEDTNLFNLQVKSTDKEIAYKVLESAIKNYPQVAEYVIGASQIDILQESGVPDKPYNIPSFRNSALKGGLFGGALGIAIIFIYAITRNTIRRQEDLKKLLNVKCIGTVPHIEFKKRKKDFDNTISLKNDKVSPVFTEAIRVIRTRIERATIELGAKAILITSAIPKEGKTTLSYNIAESLAMKDYKVILLDCDLRNPSVAERFGLSMDKPGLSEYLMNRASLKDCLYKIPGTGLYFISAGKPSNEASELLASIRMRKLIEALKEEVDYIILDTAPAAMLADASDVASYGDSAVFVVRQDYSKVYHIMEGVERLSESKLPIIGCILNNVEDSIMGDGYSRYSKYGKYGRYGYYGSKYYYGDKGN